MKGPVYYLCDSVWSSLTGVGFRTSQHASPHGGQESCTNSGAERHLGGWGAAELDGVALVRGAAGNFPLVGDGHQGAIGGRIAVCGLAAAQCGEAHGGGDGWEA